MILSLEILHEFSTHHFLSGLTVCITCAGGDGEAVEPEYGITALYIPQPATARIQFQNDQPKSLLVKRRLRCMNQLSLRDARR
jgi:hypothetical protein